MSNKVNQVETPAAVHAVSVAVREPKGATVITLSTRSALSLSVLLKEKTVFGPVLAQTLCPSLMVRALWPYRLPNAHLCEHRCQQ